MLGSIPHYGDYDGFFLCFFFCLSGMDCSFGESKRCYTGGVHLYRGTCSAEQMAFAFTFYWVTVGCKGANRKFLSPIAER